MLNNVWTTVGGIKSCTTHDACDGVVARCPFPPLFNLGNMTDVVDQCGATSFLASPQARTSFNIGERGKGIQLGRPGDSGAWIAHTGSGTGINSPDVRDMGWQPYLIAVWRGILVPFSSACDA